MTTQAALPYAIFFLQTKRAPFYVKNIDNEAKNFPDPILKFTNAIGNFPDLIQKVANAIGNFPAPNSNFSESTKSAPLQQRIFSNQIS